MTDTEPLFPELVQIVAELLPVPCAYPLFVLAYRPNIGGWGNRWKIHWPLEFCDSNHPRLDQQIRILKAKGWTNITVMRLPAGDYPWNAK